MDFLSIVQNAIPGAIAGAVSAGALSGPIKTLEDWWYINYGHKQSETAAILKAKQEINVEKLKQSTLNEVSDIPQEDIQDPKLNILGPALEASKYYIEEDDLRDMFAKLIASSMDSSKNNITHPSFVEIVKQMSSNEAKILDSIYKNNPNTDLIVKIRTNLSTGGFHTLYNNVYLGYHKENLSHEVISSSLDNLSRLGLIDIVYGQYRNQPNVYDVFLTSKQYIDSTNHVNKLNTEYSSLRLQLQNNPMAQEQINKLPDLDVPYFEKGIVEITSLGQNFCKVCLN